MPYKIDFDEIPKQVFALGRNGRPAGMIDVTPGMAVPRLYHFAWVPDEADQSSATADKSTPITPASKR